MVFSKDAIYTFETYDIRIPEAQLVRLEDAIRNNKEQLLTIDASHYGFLNSNGCIYRHDTVQYDIPSFVYPNPKPIIQNHRPETSDVFGRIIAADYHLTDFYSEIEEDWDIEGLSTEEYIDMCKDAILPLQKTNPSFNGLSYVQVVAKLTDEKAIKKVLNKEFITVSIGAMPKKMICSQCGQNQLEHLCSHYSNKRNDTFMLAESLEYEELSFVKKPADPFGRIVRIHDGIMEEVKIDRESSILDATVGVIDIESFFNNINTDKKIICTDNICTIINNNTEEDDVMGKINVSLVSEFGKDKVGALELKLKDSNEKVPVASLDLKDEDFKGMKNTQFAVVQKTVDGNEKRRFPLHNEANVRAGVILITDAEDLTSAEREKAIAKLDKYALKYVDTKDDTKDKPSEKIADSDEGETDINAGGATGATGSTVEVRDIDSILEELKSNMASFKEQVIAKLADNDMLESDPIGKIFDLLKYFASDMAYAGESLKGGIGRYLEELGKEVISKGAYDEAKGLADSTKVTLETTESKVTELSDSINGLNEEIEALDTQNVELNFQLRSQSVDELISRKISLGLITDSEEDSTTEKNKLFKLPFIALTDQVNEYRTLSNNFETKSVNNNMKQPSKVVDPTLQDDTEDNDDTTLVVPARTLSSREIQEALKSPRQDLGSLFN